MKLIILIFFILFSINAYSQDTTLITSRGEHIPPKAVLGIESIKSPLYAGQEYTFEVAASGYHDIQLTAKNAKVEFIEDSKNSTGGFRYSITPIKTGTLTITVGIQVNEQKAVSLIMYTYSVINFPIPTIQLDRKSSGEIIDLLRDSSEIKCSYPLESGIFESYEVLKWVAKMGDKEYHGDGNILSEELITIINEANDEYLHLTAFLAENKTGHLKSEAIYLVRKN